MELDGCGWGEKEGRWSVKVGGTEALSGSKRAGTTRPAQQPSTTAAVSLQANEKPVASVAAERHRKQISSPQAPALFKRSLQCPRAGREAESISKDGEGLRLLVVVLVVRGGDVLKG